MTRFKRFTWLAVSAAFVLGLVGVATAAPAAQPTADGPNLLQTSHSIFGFSQRP